MPFGQCQPPAQVQVGLAVLEVLVMLFRVHATGLGLVDKALRGRHLVAVVNE